MRIAFRNAQEAWLRANASKHNQQIDPVTARQVARGIAKLRDLTRVLQHQAPSVAVVDDAPYPALDPAKPWEIALRNRKNELKAVARLEHRSETKVKSPRCANDAYRPGNDVVRTKTLGEVTGDTSPECRQRSSVRKLGAL